MEKIILFREKSECCGCGACMNVCPKSAIRMEEDEYGFLYPKIDPNLCIGCGACKTVCGYQHLPQMHQVKEAYAAADLDHESLKRSSSGGAFGVIAKNILEKGGVVYGAALPYENGQLSPKHIRVTSVQELVQLQGSKYVQSRIGLSLQQVKKDLLSGNTVLFSGTPCQVAGLKTYLGKEYENLLLVEIICHGVPSERFFQDYLRTCEKIRKNKIQGFYFRDKSKGQGMISRFIYSDKTTEVETGKTISYITLFQKSFTYRINCYSCPFATEKRVADITLGDYWGFHEEYPGYHDKNGLSNGNGISCVLLNTEKGKKAFEVCRKQMITMESTVEKVARHNAQLRSPSKYDPRRETILDLYKENGYEAVNSYFHKHFKKEILKYHVSGLIPKSFKRSIKKMVGRRSR